MAGLIHYIYKSYLVDEIGGPSTNGYSPTFLAMRPTVFDLLQAN